MAIRLEPCPFCNSSHSHITSHLMSYNIVCQACQASGPHRQSIQVAVTEWNNLKAPNHANGFSTKQKQLQTELPLNSATPFS